MVYNRKAIYEFMKNKLKVQSVILLFGVIYAWTNVFISFRNFYGFEGTIFKFRDCYLTNPVLTPCFWGAIAFLAAFIWSLRNLKITDEVILKKSQKYLTYLLAFGTVFAFSVFGNEVFQLLRSDTGEIQTCLGSIDNPLKSSCLYGAIIYLTSFVYALKMKNGK
ncbi:hypothetical protein JXA63_05475 [Candidatus Woesebacteria bacterium]|nr:hypothetical protein [Candidatus Woesebacteria bacterium]